MDRLLLLLAATLLFGCSPGKPELRFFTWPDYIDPQVVAEFERQFDCRVTIDYFEDVGFLQSKLAAGGAAIYDVVVPGHFTVPGLVKRGLLAPLRWENIPNLRNVDPRFLNPAFDPTNRYSAPYLWGTSGIYARKPKGAAADESWGLIFDPARQAGPFLLLEDPRLCIGAALHYKGYRMNTTNRQELLEVRDLLVATKRRSLGFATSTAAKNRVLGREAAFGILYNNDALMAAAEDAETAYFVPREGGGLWLDTLSVAAQAPHRDLAEKFINFLLDARNGARIAGFTHTATANRASLEFIDPKVRADPGVYPPPEVMARLEYAVDLGEDNKLFDELWSWIKSQ